MLTSPKGLVTTTYRILVSGGLEPHPAPGMHVGLLAGGGDEDLFRVRGVLRACRVVLEPGKPVGAELYFPGSGKAATAAIA